MKIPTIRSYHVDICESVFTAVGGGLQFLYLHDFLNMFWGKIY